MVAVTRRRKEKRLIPKIVAYLSLLCWSHELRSDQHNYIVLVQQVLTHSGQVLPIPKQWFPRLDGLSGSTHGRCSQVRQDVYTSPRATFK